MKIIIEICTIVKNNRKSWDCSYHPFSKYDTLKNISIGQKIIPLL